jgi:hypothetical protein
VNKILDLVSFFFVGSIIVLIITHPNGFASSAGTVFTGITGMGSLLTGAGVTDGTATKTAAKK